MNDRSMELISARNQLDTTFVRKYLQVVVQLAKNELPTYPNIIELTLLEVLKTDTAAATLVTMVDNELIEQLNQELQSLKIRQDSIQQNLERAPGQDAI